MIEEEEEEEDDDDDDDEKERRTTSRDGKNNQEEEEDIVAYPANAMFREMLSTDSWVSKTASFHALRLSLMCEFL